MVSSTKKACILPSCVSFFLKTALFINSNRYGGGPGSRIFSTFFSFRFFFCISRFRISWSLYIYIYINMYYLLRISYFYNLFFRISCFCFFFYFFVFRAFVAHIVLMDYSIFRTVVTTHQDKSDRHETLHTTSSGSELVTRLRGNKWKKKKMWARNSQKWSPQTVIRHWTFCTSSGTSFNSHSD